jgi:hypothetical protein
MKRSGLLAVVLIGCGGGGSGDGVDAGPDADVHDPASVLVNQGTDLEAVLQTEEGRAACDAYLGGTDTSPENQLLCGKWIFFYETFGTEGLPLELAQWMMTYFPENFGAGMQAFGMFPNPDDPDGMPVGLARGPSPSDGPDVAAFTCGSCHFGRAPDGRYVVGMPNLDYDYGQQFGSFVAVGKMILDPDTDEIIEPVKQKLAAEVAAVRANTQAMEELLDIVSGIDGMGLEVSHEVQSQYHSWKPGTMDFLIVPIIDDGVHTVSRILPLWDIPSPAEAEAAGMPHQMLSWTGFTSSLDGFISGFALLSYGDAEVERLAEPLAAFIATLEPPVNEGALDDEAVERGRLLFDDAGCAECHDGPALESTRTYPFAEIGTDDAMADIFSPDDQGQPCCGFEGSDRTTGEIKAPRLTGLWTLDTFLHNGSVDGLEALFCLDGERPTITEPVFADSGHMETCDPMLSADDRRDLIEFLRSL